jgi:hypothetical protein
MRFLKEPSMPIQFPKARIKYSKTRRWKYRLEEAYVVPLASLAGAGIDVLKLLRFFGPMQGRLQRLFLNITFIERTGGDNGNKQRNYYLVIERGYCWNGPSGPTVDTKSFMRGALLHDVLYQLISEGMLPRSCREAADRILRAVCLDDGMCRPRAFYVYKAVRIFGRKAAQAKPEPPTLQAP